MTKLKIPQMAKHARTFLTKHSPEILTGLGVAGMLTTTVLAVKATPKAVKLLDKRKEELDTYELPASEVIKTTWKCYIPAAAVCATSIACLVGASSVNARRNAVLATAYNLSRTALTEYKDAVVDTIGEKEEQVIRGKIAEGKLKKDPVSGKEVHMTKIGDTLCYDVLSGRYFKSSMEELKRAENIVNKQLMNDMYLSLNEFYGEIGLSYTSLGDNLGWRLDDGFIELSFSSQIADNGEPCLVVDYNVAPKYDYYRS